MKVNNAAMELSPIQVLVISPSQENRAALQRMLVANGLTPILCGSLLESRHFLEANEIRVVICDDSLPDNGLRSIVEEGRKRPTPLPVIAVSRTGDWKECLDALRIGAFDYLALPPDLREVDRILKLALRETVPRRNLAMTGLVPSARVL